MRAHGEQSWDVRIGVFELSEPVNTCDGLLIALDELSCPTRKDFFFDSQNVEDCNSAGANGDFRSRFLCEPSDQYTRFFGLMYWMSSVSVNSCTGR